MIAQIPLISHCKLDGYHFNVFLIADQDDLFRARTSNSAKSAQSSNPRFLFSIKIQSL